MADHHWKPFHPPHYDDVLDAIKWYGEYEDTGRYRRVSEKVYTEKMDVSNLYMLEALASKISRSVSNNVYTADLAFLIWAREYEYFSRSHVVTKLAFLSTKRQYEFFKRQFKNGFVERIGKNQIGVKFSTVFYLTSFGKDVADKVYEVLKNGDTRYFKA